MNTADLNARIEALEVENQKLRAQFAEGKHPELPPELVAVLECVAKNPGCHRDFVSAECGISEALTLEHLQDLWSDKYVSPKRKDQEHWHPDRAGVSYLKERNKL